MVAEAETYHLLILTSSMFFPTLFVLSIVSSVLAAPSPRFAPPEGFEITSVGVIGTGCPPGSAYVLVSDDATALTAVFSELNAEAGPGVSIRNNRRACQLSLGVNVPEGYRFSLKTVESAGYYQLDEGVTASQGTYYYFQGQLAQANARGTYNGPVDGKDYVLKEEFSESLTSPCGKATVLNINTDVRVSNSKNANGFGFLSKDFLQFRKTLNLEWQAC